MAKNPRNRGKLTRRKARYGSEADADCTNGIIIDLNAFTPPPP